MKRTNELTKEEQREYNCITHNMCVIRPDLFHATTTRKVARLILTQSHFFNAGDMYVPVWKARGLGVGDLTLRKK